MAFHVGCPITCKRICTCPLGFPRSNGGRGGLGTAEFSSHIAQLQRFLEDPWLIRVTEGSTIQVPVPPLPPPISDGVDHDSAAASSAVSGADESAQTKRVAVQKKAAVASMAAEDFAKRFENTAPLLSQDGSGSSAVEEQVSSNGKAMCRICFSGEIEGSENAMKMIPCTSCGKRYHKGCVTKWSQYRDLFHWSSWKCPSCRTCEVCRRNGEPNKFRFCKRCDGAFHCYCMQPPHKNVSSGPYLCSKHTKCHSCGSNVPGNGQSVRWFLGYTCCDACGRLFTKGNYCPACLKVYRDSEATPMVCCDICQRWVHLQCDGISDERYLQFQIDRNLSYTCPTCRGECSQLRSLEDAVQELWRRRDEEDRDLIASLRAAAGLPTEEEIFSITPFSDDEDNGPGILKGDHGRLRYSSKKLADFSPKKKIKESGKKQHSKNHGKKKGYLMSVDGKLEVKFEEYNEPQLSGSRLGDKKVASHQSGPVLSSHLYGSLSHSDRMCSNNEQGFINYQFTDEDRGNNMERRATDFQIKSKKLNNAGSIEDVGQVASKPKTTKGTKLVIHLGGRNKTITNSPRSDSSSCQRDQELASLSGGNETASQQRIGDYPFERLDGASNSDDGCKVDVAHEGIGQKPRDRNIIKLGKGKSEASGLQSHRRNGLFGLESTNNLSFKRRNEASAVTEGLHYNASKSEKLYFKNHTDNKPVMSDDNSNKLNKPASPALEASVKDSSRPSLKLKFKTPYPGSWAPITDQESVSVKGQRSKRKRPSSVLEKPKHHEQEDVTESQDVNLMNEVMDANWILKKLGKDGVGKRVEVQLSDDSWHKGLVNDVIVETSMLSIDLDDGRAKNLELGKQGIRFVTRG